MPRSWVQAPPGAIIGCCGENKQSKIRPISTDGSAPDF